MNGVLTIARVSRDGTLTNRVAKAMRRALPSYGVEVSTSTLGVLRVVTRKAITDAELTALGRMAHALADLARARRNERIAHDDEQEAGKRVPRARGHYEEGDFERLAEVIMNPTGAPRKRTTTTKNTRARK